MTDKSTVRQVLGMLMQHPQYMSQVDKYTLTLADFPTRFDKYLFSAISNLYRAGATKIFPIDVATYLETDTVGKKVFAQNNGVDYLQDAIDYCAARGLEFYSVNSNFPEENADIVRARKLEAELFIDDRNLGGIPDWGVIYQMVMSGNPFKPAPQGTVIEEHKRKKGLLGMFG